MAKRIARPVEIHLLGRFEIVGGAKSLSAGDFTRRRKSSRLVKLLALAPARVMNREQILDQLWPDVGAEAAVNDLYKQINFLRGVFSDAGVDEGLVSMNGAVLSLSSDVIVDVDEFRRLSRTALDLATDPAAYEGALKLWRGDLLPGELYEAWTEPHREELRDLRRQLVRKLADVYEIRGKWEQAANLLRSAQDGATDEETARALMRVYALAADRESAFVVYSALRDSLAEELDVEPSAETQRLYESIRNDASGGTQMRGGDIPLVGRDDELRALRRVLADAAAGRGGIATIAGEPGIGKTRLVQAFTEYARLKDAKVIVGRCLRDEGAPPYHPWIEILNAILPAMDADARAMAIGPGVEEMRELLPELRALFESLPDGPNQTGERARFRLFDTVNRVLESIARKSVLVIVLEDLHDADSSTLDLLQSVVREAANRRLLLVATHRIGEELAREPIRRAMSQLLRAGPRARIEPKMLNRAELRQLLEFVAEGPITDAQVDRIARESGGNPLYAREYARLLSSEPSTGAMPVPRSIQGIVSERTRSFSPACAELLSNASAVGARFDSWLLGRVAGMTSAEVVDALGEALRANVVRRYGDRLDEFEFTHDVLRKSLYGEIPPARLGTLHSSIGEALEALGERDRHLAQLAYHFDRAAQLGGDVERAIGYMMRAGDDARLRFAWSEARACWESALSLMERGRVDPGQVADLLERIEDLIFSNGGDYQDGLNYLERALSVRQQLGDEERVAQIHSRLGRALSTHIGDIRFVRYMDIPRSIEHYKAAESVLTRGPARPAVVYFYAGLASAAYNGMRTVDGLAASERAMDAAQALGMDALWATAALLRGAMLKASGRLNESREMLAGAYKIADERNDPLVAYYTTTNIADWTDGYRAGNGELYERELEKKRFAAAPIQRNGLLEDLGCSLCVNGRIREAEALPIENPGSFFKGLLLQCAGDWDRAEEVWREGFETLAAVGHNSAYVNRAHQLAMLSYTKGDAHSAERLLRQELKMAIDGDGTLIELRARIALARLCVDDGRVAEASEQVARCRAVVADGQDWGVFHARVEAVAATLAAARGDSDAPALFASAATRLDEANLVWERAELDLQRARAATRSGDASEARRAIREAEALYKRIGAGDAWLKRARRFARVLAAQASSHARST